VSLVTHSYANTDAVLHFKLKDSTLVRIRCGVSVLLSELGFNSWSKVK
jgi:hypothetical protein